MAQPLKTNQVEVDGSRLVTLNVSELRSLLDLRIAKYHQHLEEYGRSCSENNFTFIKPIIEVLNAMQNSECHMKDGTLRTGFTPTLFLPPLYKDRT